MDIFSHLRRYMVLVVVLLFVESGFPLTILGYYEESFVLQITQYDKPDLFTITWSLDRCGNNEYAPSSSNNSCRPFRSWRIGPFCNLHEFFIGLQNDGDAIMSCTIETNVTIAHGFNIGLLCYAPGKYLNLTHDAEWIPTTINPGEIYGMKLLVLGFLSNNHEIVKLTASSSRGTIDWIFCDTSLS